MRAAILRAIAVTGAFSLSLYAANVSLTNDFSIANGNPNGQWVYQDNTTNLSLQTPQNNGNTLYPAVSNGYWGLGNDLNTNTPDLFKAQVNGSSAGETDLDFLAGDVVGHSPNDGSGLFMRWTAPSAGTVSNLALSVWYAHSATNPGRANDYSLLDNSATLASGTVSSSAFFDRNHPATYNNVAGFAVLQGDIISLDLSKNPAQPFGSLSGMSLNFDFAAAATATPEPATMALVGLGLAAIGLRSRHRRR